MAENIPSRRERQARQTRDEILGAARQLFAERGYARTSVRDVAAAAGVSAQTVYDSVGSKRALVAQLNDLIDGEAGVVGLAVAAAEATDPVQVVETPARVTRRILERCGDIIRALVSGAAADPDLATVLAEGHQRHVAGAAQVVEHLRRLGALREGLAPEEAAETLAAVSDVQVALLLHEDYGWSFDRLEAWMGSTSRALLLP